MPATKTRTFRLSKLELARIRRLAEHLGASERQAISLAVLLLSERLGLIRSAAVELAEEVARQHGDAAPIVATVRHDPELGYVAECSVAGEPWPDLTARAIPYVTEIDGRAQLQHIAVELRDEARDTHFAVGTVLGADRVTVRASDLPGLVVQRSAGRSDRQVRDGIAADLKLRALLKGADDDEEEDEP